MELQRALMPPCAEQTPCPQEPLVGMAPLPIGPTWLSPSPHHALATDDPPSGLVAAAASSFGDAAERSMATHPSLGTKAMLATP